ncbi:PilZ domain-containing protein [Thermodesulfobacteriota bacterium]
MTLFDKDTDGYEELSVFDQLVELISKMTDGEQEKLLEALKKRRPEKREDRMEVHTVTRFTVGGEEYKGVVLDFSPSGLFIETDESFSVGQEISIHWERSRDAKIIKVRGRIARVKSNGIGVQFYK